MDHSECVRSNGRHSSFCSFFFQAEDGIRDWSVTGVQTCALPILLAAFHTHPLIILGNQVYPNWFYEAPLILHGKSSAARVEWMISILERTRAAQREIGRASCRERV